MKRSIMFGAFALLVALMVGTTSALAHGGPGRGGRAAGGKASISSSLVADAATKLGVTTARLRQAIVASANARIDDAVEDEDIDAEDAAELKEEATDNLRFAYQLSTTAGVARNLDVTTTRLNTAFRDARREQLVERIDGAVEDGDLDADEAAELKEEVADLSLPGYKPVNLGRLFGGRGFGGFGG